MVKYLMGILICLVWFSCGFSFANLIRMRKVNRLLRAIKPEETNSIVELEKMREQMKLLKHFTYFLF